MNSKYDYFYLFTNIIIYYFIHYNTIETNTTIYDKNKIFVKLKKKNDFILNENPYKLTRAVNNKYESYFIEQINL